MTKTIVERLRERGNGDLLDGYEDKTERGMLDLEAVAEIAQLRQERHQLRNELTAARLALGQLTNGYKFPAECCTIAREALAGIAVEPGALASFPQRRIPASREEALVFIERVQREVEIVCDHFGVDPAEFLADSRAEKSADQWTPEQMAAFQGRQAASLCQGCFRPVSACVCASMKSSGYRSTTFTSPFQAGDLPCDHCGWGVAQHHAQTLACPTESGAPRGEAGDRAGPLVSLAAGLGSNPPGSSLAETRDYLAARDAHDRVALELYRYKRCLYRANGRLMQIGQEPEKLDYSDSPELKSNPARECQCATYCMAAAGMTWDPPVKCRGLTGKDPGAHLRYPRV